MNRLSPDMLQRLYRIALEIGTSLELRVMLERALHKMNEELSLPLAAVIAFRKEDFHQVLIVSEEEHITELHGAAVNNLLPSSGRQEREQFLKRLPFTESIGGSLFLHLMEISGYGILSLIRKDTPLDGEILSALLPLVDRLATACRSCIIREEQVKLETIMLSMKQTMDSTVFALESFFENAPLMAIHGFDRKGIVKHWNNNAAALYGFTAEETLGRQIQNLLLPAELVAEFEETLSTVWSTGNAPSTREWSILNNRGEERHVYSSLFPLVKDGEVLEVFCISIDITERRRAEEQTKSSEAKYRSIVQNFIDGIYLVNFEGYILEVNDNASGMLGYDNDELIGRHLRKLHSPDTRHHIVENMDILREQNYTCFDSEFVKADGSPVAVNIKVVVVSREGPGIVQAIVRDMSERKRFETELITAKEKAENMSRLKSAFLSNMSHEIRTPVHGITGFASLLRDSLKEQDQREMIGLIIKSTERLMSTIDDILDFSRLETRNYTVLPQPVDIIRETRSVLAPLEPLAAEKDLYLTFEASPDSIIVDLDRQAYGKVLTNIVGNAIKFSHSGGVTVCVSLKDSSCRIRIKDTGVGIPSEYFETIFDEFRQVSEGYSRSHEGSGLGLTITRDLVSLMGGTVYIEESTINRGTTFAVVLPLLKTHHLEPDLLCRKAEIQKPVTEKQRILFVEDDHVNMMLAKQIFKRRDSYHIDFSASAEEGLRNASMNAYKIILLDIGLGGGMNGIDLMKAIKEKTENRKAIFVAVTGFAMKEQRQELKSLFDDYLSKPYEEEELIEIIERYSSTH
ncbi:MAG: PAS domain S-box protein [Candidatus Xenobiia bacterium LiM19]